MNGRTYRAPSVRYTVRKSKPGKPGRLGWLLRPEETATILSCKISAKHQPTTRGPTASPTPRGFHHPWTGRGHQRGRGTRRIHLKSQGENYQRAYLATLEILLLPDSSYYKYDPEEDFEERLKAYDRASTTSPSLTSSRRTPTTSAAPSTPGRTSLEENPGSLTWTSSTTT